MGHEVHADVGHAGEQSNTRRVDSIVPIAMTTFAPASTGKSIGTSLPFGSRRRALTFVTRTSPLEAAEVSSFVTTIRGTIMNRFLVSSPSEPSSFNQPFDLELRLASAA